MPCRDPSPEEYARYTADENERLKKEVKFLEASLCMSLNAIDSMIIASGDKHFVDLMANDPEAALRHPYFNYEEAGVTRKELADWWEHHKETDRIRKVLEAQRQERIRLENERKELADKARAKLSDAELIALGLKPKS